MTIPFFCQTPYNVLAAFLFTSLLYTNSQRKSKSNKVKNNQMFRDYSINHVISSFNLINTYFFDFFDFYLKEAIKIKWGIK